MKLPDRAAKAKRVNLRFWTVKVKAMWSSISKAWSFTWYLIESLDCHTMISLTWSAYRAAFGWLPPTSRNEIPYAAIRLCYQRSTNELGAWFRAATPSELSQISKRSWPPRRWLLLWKAAKMQCDTILYCSSYLYYQRIVYIKFTIGYKTSQNGKASDAKLCQYYSHAITRAY